MTDATSGAGTAYLFGVHLGF